MNVFYINDSNSNRNWGDRAAAYSLKRMIRQAGGKFVGNLTEDQLKKTALANDGGIEDRQQEPHGAKLAGLLLPPAVPKLLNKVSSRLRRSKPTIIPMNWSEFEMCADRFTADFSVYESLFNSISSADVVMIHGDGCMVGNGVIARTVLFLAYIVKRRFDKPVVIANHTVDFAHTDLFEIARRVYPLFNDVVYRDQMSASRYAAHWSGRYAADSAFLFKPAKRQLWSSLASRPTFFDVWPDRACFDPQKPYICIGGSSNLDIVANLSDIVQNFRFLIDQLRLSTDLQIVLTASDLHDEIIFRLVAEADGLPLIGLTTPVQQAVDIVGNAAAYIGGRWHPSIFALRGGTPVVPISSRTHKINALVSMAGLDNPVIDSMRIADMSTSIAQQTLSYLDQGDVVRARLADWAKEEARSAIGNVDYLKRFAGQPT